MTPNEIYDRPVVRVADITTLVGTYYNHIPEVVDENSYAIVYDFFAPRVEVRCVKEFYFDHRRIWRLAGVWFKPDDSDHFVPVMIIQNAGREGDDYHKRFVTNLPKFREMVAYLRGLIPVEEIREYNPNVPVPGIDDFYNHHLNGHFERTTY